MMYIRAIYKQLLDHLAFFPAVGLIGHLDHDDIKMIIRLADGRRVEVVSNFIELGGDFVELKGGHAVPIWAIEKVGI